MGIRQSETKVVSSFTTDQDGNPTGGHTTIEFHGPLDASTTVIHWQDGIVDGEGQNGAFVEDVIEAARQRIQFFNTGKFRCRENSIAITKLEEALQWLDWRTRQRLLQDVENTYDVHTEDSG